MYVCTATVIPYSVIGVIDKRVTECLLPVFLGIFRAKLLHTFWFDGDHRKNIYTNMIYS